MAEATKSVIVINGIEFHKTHLRIDEIEQHFPLTRTKIYELIREQIFTAYCPNGKDRKPIFIATLELKEYFEKIAVPKDKWTE